MTRKILVGGYALFRLWRGGWVVSFPRHHNFRPDWEIIRSLFRFGLPTGIQGIAMNVGGVLMLGFIGSLAQSAAAQAACAISYTQLFSLVTWTSIGLMGAAAAVAGQNLGAGHPDRADRAVHVAASFGLSGAAVVGLFFVFLPRQLLAVFGMDDPAVVGIGVELLRILGLSGLFIAVALTYTGGLQGTGATRSPLYISIVSQVVVPLGISFVSGADCAISAEARASAPAMRFDRPLLAGSSRASAATTSLSAVPCAFWPSKAERPQRGRLPRLDW